MSSRIENVCDAAEKGKRKSKRTKKKSLGYRLAQIKEYDAENECYMAFFTEWPDKSVAVPTDITSDPDIMLLPENYTIKSQRSISC